MDDWRGEWKQSVCVCVCACAKGEAFWQGGKEKPAGLLEHSGKNPASFCTTETL